MKRFYDKTEPEPMSGCLLWTGYVASTGYGVFRMNTKARRAHRVAWELERGEIPEGLCVLHKCDVPACVNVDHLFLGTQADNVADRHAKNRGAKGESHHAARLSEDDVREARKAWRDGVMNYTQLAVKFGVTDAAMSYAVRGVTWKHVTQAKGEAS